MINYNEYDMIPLEEAADLLKFLGGEPVDDDEVWAYSRESSDVPIFENDIYDLTCMRIEDLLNEKYPDIIFVYQANCRVSSFSISNDMERVFNDFDSNE